MAKHKMNEPQATVASTANTNTNATTSSMMNGNGNPNLTKRDQKLIEKLHAKIEYLEVRDQWDAVEILLEQIEAIGVSANCRAFKKADKIAKTEWATRRAEKRAAAEVAAKKKLKQQERHNLALVTSSVSHVVKNPVLMVAPGVG